MKKSELNELIKSDRATYKSENFIHSIFDLITRDNRIIYKKIIITSRKYNYYKNKGSLFFLHKLYYTRKLIVLSRKYNINIKCKFGKNLKIFHENLSVNQYANLGDNVVLHGANCIGNNGKDYLECPKIGSNVDIGYGATIIGNIEIADNIIIGANSLVNKSFLEPNVIIAGNPARVIKSIDK